MHGSALELIYDIMYVCAHRLACLVHACACGCLEGSIWSFDILPGLVWLGMHVPVAVWKIQFGHLLKQNFIYQKKKFWSFDILPGLVWLVA
jgi:hypothetical protein